MNNFECYTKVINYMQCKRYKRNKTYIIFGAATAAWLFRRWWITRRAILIVGIIDILVRTYILLVRIILVDQKFYHFHHLFKHTVNIKLSFIYSVNLHILIWKFVCLHTVHTDYFVYAYFLQAKWWLWNCDTVELFTKLTTNDTLRWCTLSK